MTTTEGHDMPDEGTPPITVEELADIREHYSGVDEYDAVPRLLAEVDRLRAQVAQYQRSADEHVAKFDRNHEALVNATSEVVRLHRENLNLREMIDAGSDRFQRVQAEVERLEAELKAAKSPRFENNSVGDVARHIQAETTNDLRLN
jgi:uncharacterized coiled-coil DUF342 family protein